MTNKIAKVIAISVVVLAILVMAGWFLDITFLKSVSPNWVTMKFITAICFVLSGIELYLSSIKSGAYSGWRDLLQAFVIYVLLLIVAGLMLSIFFGTSTGIEELFVKEQEGALYTTLPGRPDLFTLIAFLVISIGGLWNPTAKNYFERLECYKGVALILLGSIAVAGYLINYPPFFYKLNSLSEAMSIHTAILFILLGFGFFSISADS